MSTDLIKNKEDELTVLASNAVNNIRKNFGLSTRITDIWTVLPRVLLDQKQFDIVDLHFVMNGDFDAYLVDELISFKRGDNVDFTNIKNKLLEVGDFTTSELLSLKNEFADEAIWGFFKYVDSPF